FNASIEYEQFVAHEDIEPKLLLSNFSLQSNTFRHALRLSIATITGYIISKFLPFGHSYWILLTIIVILKPAYSLTKKRNYNRLIGTIVGALFGFAILFFIQDKTAVFVIMVLLMIGAYSFMRTNYLVFVSLMTPYILLLFHLLKANNFKAVVTDRIIDTAIGSAIAFIANIFLLPVWEHEQVTDYMIKMIEDNLQYFLNVVSVFTPSGDGGTISVNQYKLSRKNAFVSLANLSDAFNRMLSEPKNKQKNIREVHQFVVANHMLTSSIATLSLFTQQTQINNDLFSPVVSIISDKLNDAKKKLEHQTEKGNTENKIALRVLNDKLNDLLGQRKKELDKGITESETKKDLAAFKPIADQFNFINKAASDIEKLSDAFRGNE
ncbi:MAG TPA: FUSC family protein, partial [Puia sp.]